MWICHLQRARTLCSFHLVIAEFGSNGQWARDLDKGSAAQLRFAATPADQRVPDNASLSRQQGRQHAPTIRVGTPTLNTLNYPYSALVITSEIHIYRPRLEVFVASSRLIVWIQGLLYGVTASVGRVLTANAEA